MKNWLRLVPSAVRMGLTWAVVWVPVGFLIEVVQDIWPNSLTSQVDIWPAALGGPALLGGFAFSMLLGIAGRRRRFAELSIPGVAALGAAGGALVSLGPALLVALGLASVSGGHTLWEVTASMMWPIALVCGTSAAGSLWLARRAERRESLAGSQ